MLSINTPHSCTSLAFWLQDHFLHLLHSHLTSEATATAAARNLAALAAWVHKVCTFHLPEHVLAKL